MRRAATRQTRNETQSGGARGTYERCFQARAGKQRSQNGQQKLQRAMSQRRVAASTSSPSPASTTLHPSACSMRRASRRFPAPHEHLAALVLRRRGQRRRGRGSRGGLARGMRSGRGAAARPRRWRVGGRRRQPKRQPEPKSNAAHAVRSVHDVQVAAEQLRNPARMNRSRDNSLRARAPSTHIPTHKQARTHTRSAHAGAT
jgi:hypothetical protein